MGEAKATTQKFTGSSQGQCTLQVRIVNPDPHFFWIEIHRILYFIHSQSLRTVEEKMTKAEVISSVVENPRLWVETNLALFVRQFHHCSTLCMRMVARYARNYPGYDARISIRFGESSMGM
jgi:hypothetical protein